MCQTNSRFYSPALLAEYAYVLAIGAKLYTVTDVKDLYDWEVEHLDAHPLFRRLTEDEMVGCRFFIFSTFLRRHSNKMKS